MAVHPDQTAATPGPWKVEDYTQDVSRPTFFVVPATYYGTVAKTDNPANARLIAAAPDLLNCLKLLEQRGFTQATWSLCLAAISRAEGRTEPKAGE